MSPKRPSRLQALPVGTPVFYTPAERGALLRNGRAAFDGDHAPVVRLASGDGRAAWLLTALDPRTERVAWGAAALGVGCPQEGPIDLAWLAAPAASHPRAVLRDTAWRADGRPLSALMSEARRTGRLTPPRH